MSRLGNLIRTHQERVLSEWLREQSTRGVRRELIREGELRVQSQEMLHLLADGFDHDASAELQHAAWRPLREQVAELSRSRQLQGFTPSESVHFVVSLRRPLVAL